MSLNKLLRSIAAATALAIVAALIAVMPAAAETPAKKLTIMIYMTGSDLESGYGAGTNDISEMLRYHTDADNVNLLVMTGGSSKWWGGFPSDRTMIYELKDRRPQEVWSADVMNMGESDTLVTLLDFGYANYPAENYALVFWDHGGGPLMGVCADELHIDAGVSDMLDMVELQTALSMSPCARQSLEWIGFDACLMSSVETAYICAPYARYMIASQEVEPGSGWNYSFLTGISADADGAATGVRIADAYFDSFATMGDMYPLTMSCIDLSRIYDVEAQLDSMFSQINGVLDENSFSMLSNKRRDTRALGRASTGSEYDLVDLYNLTQQYADQAPDAADALMACIDEAVVYHRSNIDNTNGLSVYYPYFNKDYYTYMWETEYSRLFFAPGYTGYLRNFASIWLGESMSSWSGLRASALAPLPEDESVTLTMELTDDQLANFSAASLYVMSHDETLDHYSFVYSTNDVTLEGNTLTATYNNRALYAVDSNGDPLTGSLEYHVTEDTYLLRAVLMEGEHELDGDALPVYLQLVPVDGTNELQVVGVIDLSQDLGLNSGKQNVSLDSGQWQTVSIIRYPSYATRDEDGVMLPFSQWEDSSWVFADYFSLDQDWSIQFVEENYNTDEFAAQIAVTDTQGNEYASDLTLIPNHNVEEFSIEPATLIDNEFITIELTGASYSRAAYDPGIRFHMRTTNKTDEGITISTRHYMSGDLVMDSTGRIADALEPGETVDTMLDLPAYRLYENNITAIDALDFEISVASDETLDNICTEKVTINGPIDLSPIMPEPPTTASPVTEPAADSLSIEMFGLEENADGTYSCWLRYVNNSDIDYDTHATDAIINGCVVPDLFLHEVWLPSGATRYEYVILAQEGEYSSLYLEDLPRHTNAFAYWGIDAIETMSIKLMDPDYNNVYIDVTLPGPIELTGIGEPESAWPLYEDENIYVGIKQVYYGAEYGNLNVLLHTVNKTDRPVELGFDSILLNGESVYASGESDTSSLLSMNYGVNELRPGLTERWLIELAADELPEGTEFETVSFCMSIGYDGESPRYTDLIVITLPDGATADTIPENGYGYEELEISDVTFASSLAPTDLIEQKVLMPENAAEYARTISTQLTDEQAAAFSSGRLIMIQKLAVSDSEIFRLICAADSLALDGSGMVSGKYSGLLLSPAGYPENLITFSENSHADGAVDITGGYITIRDGNFQLDSIYVNDIMISGSGNSANVVEAHSDSEYIRSYAYSWMQHWYYDVVPAYKSNGTLVHYTDMASPDFSAMCENGYENGKLQLELRPVTAYDGIYALFAIENTDGSGYCLEPIPLD